MILVTPQKVGNINDSFITVNNMYLRNSDSEYSCSSILIKWNVGGWKKIGVGSRTTWSLLLTNNRLQGGTMGNYDLSQRSAVVAGSDILLELVIIM